MLFLDEGQTRAGLPWRELIEALRARFVAGCEAPWRHHHEIEFPGEENGTLLLMPAWTPGNYIGVKLVNVVPGNSKRALPAISGIYILSSGKTGEVLAILDGAELTARRTAAVSALAASYLARRDSRRLLMVGAGRLSLNLIQAHAMVLPIEKVEIWARRPEQAEQIAAKARAIGFDATSATNLEQSVRAADLISCCTLSSTPLVRGSWLSAGTHLDLVGAFTPNMRESDDEAMRRSTIFVDTRDGAIKAGDIAQPLKDGSISLTDIAADLSALVREAHHGRTSPSEITVFKSAGAAIEDLAGAELVFRRAHADQA